MQYCRQGSEPTLNGSLGAGMCSTTTARGWLVGGSPEEDLCSALPHIAVHPPTMAQPWLQSTPIGQGYLETHCPSETILCRVLKLSCQGLETGLPTQSDFSLGKVRLPHGALCSFKQEAGAELQLSH